MNVYLISCDLNNPERDYTSFFNEIQKYDSMLCFDTTWLVKTEEDIDELENNIITEENCLESIIICKVENPLRANLSTRQWDWINGII